VYYGSGSGGRCIWVGLDSLNTCTWKLQSLFPEIDLHQKVLEIPDGSKGVQFILDHSVYSRLVHQVCLLGAHGMCEAAICLLQTIC